MRRWALLALMTGALFGFIGFAVGRRTALRPAEKGSASPAAPRDVVAPPIGSGAPAHQPRVESAPPGEPVVQGEPAAKPPAPPLSAKDRLFSLLLPHFSEDKKHQALWSAVVGNPEMQRRVFDLLMASEERDLLEAGQDLLISIRDPGLLKDVMAAFGAETNPERRAMLAYALGGNVDSPDAKPLIDSILSGGDPRLMKQVLARLNVQGSGHAERAEYIPQLRHLVMSGPTPDIRAGAARSLRGDRSEEGIKFLIDRMLTDENPEVQYQAMVALPVTFSGGGAHEEVQFRNLMLVALDESRPERMRRWAADRALMGTHRYKNLMTEDQRAIFQKLAAKPGAPQKGKPN